MKVIKSLLKLSAITLSSAIVITNPGINSLLGVEQASAENYFDTRRKHLLVKMKQKVITGVVWLCYLTP